jgi:hypothetical protein
LTALNSQVTALISLITLVGLVVGAYFSIRYWLRPLRIIPAWRMVLDNSGPDQILATVTNVSKQDQYLVRCVARTTYPLMFILRRHLRHPLIRPRLYPNIRYSGQSYSLMGDSTIKLEPLQRPQLHHSVSASHPLAGFLSDRILIEVELSTGRVFRSGRIVIPVRWLLASRQRQS